MKKVSLFLTLSVVFLVVSALTPNAFATSASISVSGTEGAIPLTATASFTSYPHCDDAQPPNCWNVDSGTLYVYHNGGLIAQVGRNGSASWSTTLDGGSMAQGDHTFTAMAIDSEGISHSSQTTITIDNTPSVTVSSPGQVNGEFDITSTASFKEHVGGPEGVVNLAVDDNWCGEKSYEGTSIAFSYSELCGHMLDAGQFSQGPHTIKVGARAYNGALSDLVEDKFTVSILSKVKNFGAGCSACKFRTRTTGPINFSTGNKYQKEKDFDLGGPGLPLGFSRYYNSQSTLSTTVGYGWSATFSEYLTFETGKTILHQADGAEVHFIDNGQGKFVSETDKVRVIESVEGGGYRLTEPDGRSLNFDGAGKLVQIMDRNGNTQTLAYSSGRLASVEDNFGRRLDFTYNPDGRLATLSTPIGDFTYSYDGQGNLTMVQKPDLTTRTYLYEDPNDVHNLTGIINERGIRSLTVQYDNQDRAILSEGAGGAKSVTIVYDNNFVRHVTDSLGRTTTFKLYVEKGIARVKQVSGEGCGSCLGSLGESYEFDERLYVTRETDAEGVVTTYTYDDRGNVLTRTEAVGTSEERTTTYTYHPSLDLVASITRTSVANPGENTTTTFTYDGQGNLLSRTETGFSGTDPVTRTTTYTYNSLGQVTGIDGPRTDIQDVTAFEYYPNTSDQGLNRGRLKKITDALGDETTFSQYNAFGKPLTGTDPNAVLTAYTYDLMGRLKTRTTAGFTNTFSYDEGGNLTLSHYQDGREFSYTYTDQGWLERIQCVLGNSLNYLYDTEGNRTREEVKDDQGTLLRYTAFEYDGRNRLSRTLYPDSTDEERSYDEKGNLLSLVNQKGESTSYAYDPLDRLVSVTQPGSVVTSYTYDRHDNLLGVTDAENHTTTYTYDDLGRLLSTLSPDTNNTSYTYDAAGNLISKTDANGITATYTYDLLNRLIAVSFPDSAQDISFTYDQGVNGKGRLTGMTDPSGSYTYAYDALGNLLTETRVIGGITFSTQYTHNQGGPLQSVTYPSGRVVTYERDAAGRVSRVTETLGGSTRTLAENVTHLPFGPMMGLTYGNGMVETRAFDEMYRLTGLTAGSVESRSYTHDPVGNITAIADLLDPSRSQSFGYDSLGRLTSAQGIYGTETYTYDKVGNRLERTVNADTETYAYVSGTNRLQAIAGLNPVSFTYDANGNTLAMGDKGFTYTQDNRLLQASAGGATVGTYLYNGKGERVRKSADGKTFLYIWDKDGNLIAEADETGAILKEYIYLDGRLLAQVSTEAPTDTEVRVSTSKGQQVQGLKVYAFTEGGTYTGKNATTDGEGLAVFPSGTLADGAYKFRADYLSYQFWSPVITVPGGNAADVVIQEETTEVTVTVAGEAKPGVKVYLFNGAGTYLGLSQTSDAQGKVSFDLPVGKSFKFRADYLGSQYWSSVITIQAGMTNTLSIATGGGSLTVTLQKDETTPLSGVKMYLFSSTGTYLGLWGTSGEMGEVSYVISGGSYKVRADYLTQQYWSDTFNWEDRTITIHEGMADVTVTNMGLPLQGVNVYAFTATGTYLSLTKVTDVDGKVSFRLPEGSYKFRADYMGSQYWSGDTVLIPHVVNPIPISTGGGAFTLRVEKGPGAPIAGVNCYLFSSTGTYLGSHGVTDSSGEVGFNLADGSYKIRIDYLGYQFWTDVFTVPGGTSLTHTIPHQDVTVTVKGVYSTNEEPKADLNTYLFTPAGTYLSVTKKTDEEGKVVLNLPQKEYKVRADYLGAQFWSDPFTWADKVVTIHEGMANVFVNQNGTALAGVNVYVFSSTGTYLNLHGVTDGGGIASFRLPEGTYRFRGDFQGSQFWVTETIPADQVKAVNLDTGGGLFTLRVEKAAGVPLADTPVYVFSPSGTYLGITAQTNAQGEVSFALAAGWYRFRVDHMGYQFWCDALEVPSTLSYTMTIPHSDTTITVSTFYTAAVVPLEGVKVYLFTEAGSYQNQYQQTNAQGQITFSVPDQGYKVRVDYLGGQYGSDPFQWQDREVVIDEGMVDLHVTWNGAEVSGAPVYLFTETGTYLSRSVSTDPQGHAQFQVPVKGYKFRIDYNGHQYWTSVITPIAHQSLAVEVPLEQLAVMPTNNPNPTRYDGNPPVFKRDPIRVASLGSLVGILSQTVVAQVAQPKVYYYITDHLRTPQKVVDAAGAIVWSGDYRAFGEVSSGVSAVQNAFRFPGQYFDVEIGLHYNYNRYYDPSTGRYLTQDPIGLTGGINLFAYVNNNPVNSTDPTGLSEAAYGEIRSWAITSMTNFNPPSGLGDAVSSIDAACTPGRCNYANGSTANAPADQAAWNNIINSSGTDQSGGGNFMCVGHQNCWFVYSCYACENGQKVLRPRTTNLQPSGTATVSGKGTLYFCRDPLQGWCNRTDYRSGCRCNNQ